MTGCKITRAVAALLFCGALWMWAQAPGNQDAPLRPKAQFFAGIVTDVGLRARHRVAFFGWPAAGESNVPDHASDQNEQACENKVQSDSAVSKPSRRRRRA